MGSRQHKQAKNAPSFIVIGAMKAGTTSLYHYLSHHPQIGVSSRKETNFFLGRKEYSRGRDWYQSLFGEDKAVCGEASPNYTKRHLWKGVPERIARVCPDVKLIYLVRDPIERFMSHYIHNYAKGREKMPLSRVISPDSGYVKTSMYAYQIEAFDEFFNKNQILILDNKELSEDVNRTMEKIYEFIGVEVKKNTFKERFNRSSEKQKESVLERKIKHPAAQKILAPLFPKRFTERQPFEHPKLKEGDRKRLVDLLYKDTEKFRRRSNKRFVHWTV